MTTFPSLKLYWDLAMDYPEYINLTQNLAENTPSENFYKKYYSLALLRMERVEKTYKTTAFSDIISEKVKKILIITEPWCGDASAIIPIINLYFQEKGTEVRHIQRDTYPELMAQYRTHGADAIPIVIFMNESCEEIAHWGPRTQKGKEILDAHKAAPNGLDKELFQQDIQKYYAKNRGQDLITEIKNLLDA